MNRYLSIWTTKINQINWDWNHSFLINLRKIITWIITIFLRNLVISMHNLKINNNRRIFQPQSLRNQTNQQNQEVKQPTTKDFKIVAVIYKQLQSVSQYNNLDWVKLRISFVWLIIVCKKQTSTFHFWQVKWSHWRMNLWNQKLKNFSFKESLK